MPCSNLEYIEQCQHNYSIPGLVDISAGPGSLPFITLSHPSGTKAQVCLHGANVTSWQRADGSEMLYMHPGVTFDGVAPIAGGIALAWPQIGAGELPLHGLLRLLHWSLVEAAAWEGGEDPRPSVSLHADNGDYNGSQGPWNHLFEARYTISLEQPDPPKMHPREAAELADHALYNTKREEALHETERPSEDTFTINSSGGDESKSVVGAGVEQHAENAVSSNPQVATTPPSVLRFNLEVVNNNSDEPLTFTAGLLPHFLTQDISKNSRFVKVLGLGGKAVLDYSSNPMHPRYAVEQEDFLFFDAQSGVNVDRLYVDCDAEGDVFFCPGSQNYFDVKNVEGFEDIEVLHPAGSAPQVAKQCVCVAPARKVRTVKLQPGETWRGEATITAHNEYWELPPFEEEDPSTVPVPPRDQALPPKMQRGGDLPDLYDEDVPQN